MSNQKPLTVYLVRHGETAWNEEGRCQGVTDIPLTDKGLRQARAVAKALEREPICRLLTSPLQRARDTAALIAHPHAVSLECYDELKEWDQGRLEGLTGPELMKDYPGFFERWLADPAGTAPPGGEPLKDLQERAWPILDRLRQFDPHELTGPVVVVSHTLTTAVIICAALGLDLAQVHRLKIDLASISRLIFTEFGPFTMWRLAALNDRHHLSTELS